MFFLLEELCQVDRIALSLSCPVPFDYQHIFTGQEPRQTTSNVGHLKKPSIQALIHGVYSKLLLFFFWFCFFLWIPFCDRGRFEPILLLHGDWLSQERGDLFVCGCLDLYRGPSFSHKQSCRFLSCFCRSRLGASSLRNRCLWICTNILGGTASIWPSMFLRPSKISLPPFFFWILLVASERLCLVSRVGVRVMVRVRVSSV